MIEQQSACVSASPMLSSTGWPSINPNYRQIIGLGLRGTCWRWLAVRPHVIPRSATCEPPAEAATQQLQLRQLTDSRVYCWVIDDANRWFSSMYETKASTTDRQTHGDTTDHSTHHDTVSLCRPMHSSIHRLLHQKAAEHNIRLKNKSKTYTNAHWYSSIDIKIHSSNVKT